MKKYDPMNDSPKTVEEYIEYAKCWLSGDAGWRPEHVEIWMREFANVVRDETREDIYSEYSDWD